MFITNDEPKNRAAWEQILTEFPDLYIEESAYDVSGNLLDGDFSIHSTDPKRGLWGEVYDRWDELTRGEGK